MQFPLRQHNHTLRFCPLTLYGFSPTVSYSVIKMPLSSYFYNLVCRTIEIGKMQNSVFVSNYYPGSFFILYRVRKNNYPSENYQKSSGNRQRDIKSVFIDRKNGAANYEIYARKRGQNANIMRRLFARYYKFFLFQNFLQLDGVYIEYGTVFAHPLVFAVCALANAHKARTHAAPHSLFQRNKAGNRYVIFL